MLKSKTMWAAVAALVTACGSYFTQEISLAEMMQISVTAVLAIFLRHGVAKSQVAAEEAAEAASVVLPLVPKKQTKKA
jgi:hypothetical protein